MKKIYKPIFFVLCLMIIIPVAAKENKNPALSAFQKITLGECIVSERTAEFQDRIYPLYTYLGTDYIPLVYCGSMGATYKLDKQNVTVELVKDSYTSIRPEIMFNNMMVEMSPYEINMGGMRIYGIEIGGELAIPIESLQILWAVVLEDQHYSISYKPYYDEHYLRLTNTEINNESDYPFRIDYKDFYWEEGKFISKDYVNILIPPHTNLARTIIPLESKQYTYLTSAITKINGVNTNLNEEGLYGQKNRIFLEEYNKKLRLHELDPVFPPYIVKGTMKYSTGTLAANEVVEVWRAEKREYYVVKDAKDRYIRVPQDSLKSMQDPGGSGYIPSKEQIEDYINLKEFASDTEYFVWTDIYRQRTYVFKGHKENWKLEKVLLCSTGINTRLTPRGFYKLDYKIPYFGVEKGFRCKYGSVIFRDYMYHSILFDKTGNYVKEGLYQLGQRVSHGCIRMSEEDSKWFYQTLPLNTTVWIN